MPPPTSHHGTDFQLKITLWILLIAKQIMCENSATECYVTAEDPLRGKFDDTVLRKRLSGGREIALYIQSKHKNDIAYRIKIADMLPENANSKKKDPPFCLKTYFKSFCEYHRNGKTDGAMFVVCTNAGVSTDAAQMLQTIEKSSTHDIAHFHRLGATVYGLDKEKLRNNDRFKRCFDKLIEGDTALLLDHFFDQFLLISGMKGTKIIDDINELWRFLDVPSSSLFNQQMGLIERSIALDNLSNVAWTMTTFSKTKSHIDIEHIFQTIVRKLCFLHLKGWTSCICKQFENSDLEIKSSVLEQSQAYQACLTGGVHKHYSKLKTEMSCNIILQILRLIEFEYIFTDSKTFMELEEVIKDIFCFLDGHFILVIVCDQDNSRIFESVEGLINENTKGFKKTVILITSNEAQNMTEKFSLSDLTDQSKQKIFEKYSQIYLFHTYVPLENLMTEDDDFEILERLMNSTILENDKPKKNPSVESFEKIQKLYVGRSCESSNTLERENLSSREDFYSADRSLPAATMPKKSFNSEFYEQAARKVFNHAQDPPPGMDTSDKVFLFLEEAGYGKTTYMTWLAWYFVLQRPFCWVIRFNAIEYSYDFSQIIEDREVPLDANKAVRILFQLIYLTFFTPNLIRRTIEETYPERWKAKEWSECLTLSGDKVIINITGNETVEQLIALKVFQAKFNNRQIVLILDGFDEIVPHYKDIVLHLFSLFTKFKGIHKLYFTSRPYNFIEELKAVFQVTGIYRMVPFSEQHHHQFLYNYLESNIIEYGSCGDIQRKQLFKILFTIYRSLLGGLDSIPLFCKMASAILIPSIKAHVNLRNCTISKKLIEEPHVMFNRIRIIESFVNQTLNIANYEKSGCCNTASFIAKNQIEEEAKTKSIKEELSLLGIHTIIPSSFNLLTSEELKLCEKYKREIAEGQKKTGIVEGVQAGAALFIHRMFAEYFAAYWLFNNRDRLEVKMLFRNMWYWERDNVVRELFDEIAIRDEQGNDSSIHLAIIQRDIFKFKRCIELSESMIKTIDRVGRTPLHLAVQYRYDIELIRMLLRKHTYRRRIFLLNRKDELLQWRAADYARLFNDRGVIELLRPNGDNQMVRRNEQVEMLIYFLAGFLLAAYDLNDNPL